MGLWKHAPFVFNVLLHSTFIEGREVGLKIHQIIIVVDELQVFLKQLFILLGNLFEACIVVVRQLNQPRDVFQIIAAELYRFIWLLLIIYCPLILILNIHITAYILLSKTA